MACCAHAVWARAAAADTHAHLSPPTHTHHQAYRTHVCPHAKRRPATNPPNPPPSPLAFPSLPSCSSVSPNRMFDKPAKDPREEGWVGVMYTRKEASPPKRVVLVSPASKEDQKKAQSVYAQRKLKEEAAAR